jgi:hypothetical protein
MRVQVKTMRSQGRNLSGELLRQLPPRVGELVVEQKRDSELSRNTLRARLIDDKSGNDILPELSSAELLVTKKNLMRLAGLERIEKVDYAQTWSIEVL